MASRNRRGIAIFFLIFGICLVALAIALQVGWIYFSLESIALMIFGILFFAAIITGLILNTIFLLREIRRNEQHDAFLNAVTHELKTPIASIRLYLETLKTRDLDEAKRREFYDIMLADSDRLLNTVESVLLASRTREKNRLLNLSKIDLSELLNESIERIVTRYGLKKDAINFVERNAGISVSGDRAELTTAFTNLLDNAIKYSNGDVHVTVKLSGGSNEARVRISDTGAGIPPADLKRIFKRFYRVPNPSTENTKGSGLGLFIVSSIIKKHGGDVTAKSPGEGKGSIFTVRLPKA